MIRRTERITGELPDGTPLYQFEVWGMSGCRSLSWWNGAEGEDYGATAEDICYRCSRGYFVGEWERVQVGGWRV